MNKKLIVMFFLIFFLSSFAFAQSDELFNYRTLSLNLLLTNEFNVVPTSNNYAIDYASAELSWYPVEDFRQRVDDLSTEPMAKFNEGQGFFFEWRNPGTTHFEILEKSSISTKSDFLFVTRKVGFPIKDLETDYSEYLQPQDIIDVNEQIRQAAFEAVQGENDLYSAVYKIALWVEDNVEYDLSTITAEANQKASWVMENRKGVCDEITSLFISMCRSVGIPARFVTGLSYSNINLQNNGWGPHGWAEIYFPDFGWVPFDVTYKELGFVDATHIKLKTSLDSKETSMNYATKSRDTDIKPGPLEFEVEVASKGYKNNPLVSLEAEVAEPEVGFGSYNLLIVNVKNLKNYYITARVGLANVNELEILDDNFQQLLLKPSEEKRIYWLLRVSSNLDNYFIYTFPLKISGNSGEEAEASFKAANQFKDYSEDYMRLFMITDDDGEKPYSKNILLSCAVDKSKIYLNESTNISCSVDNKGEETLRNLKICLGEECATTRVPEQETSRYNYVKSFDALGIKTLAFKVSNELVEKSYYVVIDVQDKPLISITNLTFPERLGYEESSEVKFMLKKKSSNNPRNVRISVEHKMVNAKWSVTELNMDYISTFILKGNNLYLGKNDFKIIVTYDDEQGNNYMITDDFSITLKDPTLWQRIMVWLNAAEYKLEQWIRNI
ncbi:transglutaminase domain-containing protein [Candidatus Woesearchaeota archaeon]|nr:transglutaminase domain-containing protein [Candidatus Woesearchaeota archaeon]